MGSSSHLDTAIQELTSDIFSVVPIQQKKKKKKLVLVFLHIIVMTIMLFIISILIL